MKKTVAASGSAHGFCFLFDLMLSDRYYPAGRLPESVLPPPVKIWNGFDLITHYFILPLYFAYFFSNTEIHYPHAGIKVKHFFKWFQIHNDCDNNGHKVSKNTACRWDGFIQDSRPDINFRIYDLNKVGQEKHDGFFTGS
jgi:hypothetical protein